MEERLIDAVCLTIHQQQSLKLRLLPIGSEVVGEVAEDAVQRNLSAAAVKVDARYLGEAILGGFVVAAGARADQRTVQWAGGR